MKNTITYRFKIAIDAGAVYAATVAKIVSVRKSTYSYENAEERALAETKADFVKKFPNTVAFFSVADYERI